MTRARPLILIASALTATTVFGAERSFPVDCFPDRIANWQAALPAPESRFGAIYLPGIVLGPPGDSLPYQGSFTVASLGFDGGVVLAFDDAVLEDRPGPDFIVFENAFFRLPLPQRAADDSAVFAEPAIVEVSIDGVQWHPFSYDAQALADVPQDQPDGTIDRELRERLRGLAGITPTFTGNWTVPDDPVVFDPAGVGGISGAGGDAFDLAELGLPQARYVRITDAGTRVGPAGSAEGFDLDAVIAIHARPSPPPGIDSDGDRLSDAEELEIFGSNPLVADSDADGVDDGREVAGCRDPLSTATAPLFVREPRVWMTRGPNCAEPRWTFMGSGVRYDLLRGALGGLSESPAGVDLGATFCLADALSSVRGPCDATQPAAGTALFYLVRVDGAPTWGRSSAMGPRDLGGSCP